MYKKTLFIFIILLTQLSCGILDSGGEQNSWTKGKVMEAANETNISDSIKTLYKEDAARLALRDVHANDNTKKLLISIPPELIDLYYNGLIHIYNQTSLAARDSVVELYPIHTFPSPVTHEIIIAVDSTQNWVKEWESGKRFTGNMQVDQLMKKYNLQLKRYYRFPWSHTALLHAPAPLNILALAEKFEQIAGVYYAEPNFPMGDGSDINSIIESSYVKYEYKFGYGDCPSGCINRHFWVFHVYYNGDVTFIESFGAPLPW
ncbi:MAG: hypothetical protein ACE5QV_02010 [Fidelibacterota bacterium]